MLSQKIKKWNYFPIINKTIYNNILLIVWSYPPTKTGSWDIFTQKISRLLFLYSILIILKSCPLVPIWNIFAICCNCHNIINKYMLASIVLPLESVVLNNGACQLLSLVYWFLCAELLFCLCPNEPEFVHKKNSCQ